MSQRPISLRDIWQIIWKRKFWLILPIIIITGVAFGGSYLLPVKYDSSTKIIISNQKLVSRELEMLIPKEMLSEAPSPLQTQRLLMSTRSEIASSGYINTLINDLKI